MEGWRETLIRVSFLYRVSLGCWRLLLGLFFLLEVSSKPNRCLWSFWLILWYLNFCYLRWNKRLHHCFNLCRLHWERFNFLLDLKRQNAGIRKLDKSSILMIDLTFASLKLSLPEYLLFIASLLLVMNTLSNQDIFDSFGAIDCWFVIIPDLEASYLCLFR